MIKKVHNTFAILAFLTITLFWCSTIFVELFCDYEIIALIKSLIVLPGLPILIVSMIITGATGNILAKKSKKRELILLKRKRVPFIATIGLFVMVPSAIYLDYLASKELFDNIFYTVQAIELFGGAINILLMFSNIRDSKRELKS